jgi:hypothetical protein
MRRPLSSTRAGVDRGSLLGAATLFGLALIVVVLRLSFNDLDPSRFVWAGVPNADPAAVPDGLYVHPESGGFDGQFYYRLALDPLTTAETARGITLDIPSYRQQRIAYPVLGWVFSLGGRAGLLPVVLIAVNVVAATVLGAVACALAKTAGRPWWWGVAVAVAPGLAIALCRDTTELTAAALMTGGLLALRRDRAVVAAVLLTFAVLARETAMFVPAGVFVAVAIAVVRDRRRASLRPLVAGALPVAVFAAWQLVLGARWGELPVFSGAGAAGLPILGVFRTIAMGSHGKGAPEYLFDLVGMAFVVVFAVVAVAAVRRSSAPLHERVALVLAAFVVVCLNPVQWDSHLGSFRAATELTILGCLVLLTGTRGDAVSSPARAGLLATVAVSGATAFVSAVFL